MAKATVSVRLTLQELAGAMLTGDEDRARERERRRGAANCNPGPGCGAGGEPPDLDGLG